MQQSVYLLAALAADTQQLPPVGFDVEAVRSPAANIVTWEAFVSGRAKNPLADNPHVDDARVAVAEFRRRFNSGTVTSDISDSEVTSIAGLAVLASGLSSDLELLTRPCVVVRAPELLE
jgi:hypothetical protein